MKRINIVCMHISIILFLLVCSSSVCSQPISQIFAFSDANWQGDGCTIGGIDLGMEGDAGCVVVSGGNDMNYPSEIEKMIRIDKDFTHGKKLDIQIGYRSNKMQTQNGDVYLDGHHLTTINAFGDTEELRICRLLVESASFDLKEGTHTIKFVARKGSNPWDYFQVDAVQLTVHNSTSITGGNLVPFEIFPLVDGNWIGDGGTWGGLDKTADIAADRAAVIVQQSGKSFPVQYDLDLMLERDFTGREVHFSIGYRRNQLMATKGEVLWDGIPVLSCTPYVDAAAIKNVDSILALETTVCSSEGLNFASGKHRLTIKVDPDDNSNAMFQVDSILLEGYPTTTTTKRIYLDEFTLTTQGIQDGIQNAALMHFISAVHDLGLRSFNVDGNSLPKSKRLILTCGDKSESFLSSEHQSQIKSIMDQMKPFQLQQAYYISYQSTQQELDLRVGSFGPHGCVYAISDLQLRLRKDGERVYIDFPEWGNNDTSGLIVEKPSIEDRGEYLNIGYNYKDITPHEWSLERWKQYIDLLILARLNRLYFYIWNDVYTLYPGSEFSKNPLNKKIHENIQAAIDYAHSRGLYVTYMLCPTYFPADIWKKHPEIHAEIEYVDHGFPAVCANAPGAWEMMKDIYRSEMKWFAKADALQIWFYDPGGCWCEKNGCRQNQAKILARQFKEFSDLFREFNSAARIEFNIWPIWLWEHTMKIDYRKDLSLKIKEFFPDQYTTISAVGAPDNDTTLPLLEKELGFESSAFIFGTNPETGYIFLIPNLQLLSDVSRSVYAKGIHATFGHRLEAWTRYPSTFFMGQYLWNPLTTNETVVHQFSSWVTANPTDAIKLTEALLLLDRFTYEGAGRDLGQRMSQLARQAFTDNSTPMKQNCEYIPSMLDAIAAIASSVGVDDNSCLTACVEAFGDALRSSPTFAPFAENKKFLFEKYRGFLIKGSKKSPF